MNYKVGDRVTTTNSLSSFYNIHDNATLLRRSHDDFWLCELDKAKVKGQREVYIKECNFHHHIIHGSPLYEALK